MSQAEWEALPALLSGFTAGKASSAQVNKAIRQSTTIAALVGQFIANSGVDALDDADVDGLVTKFINALAYSLKFTDGSTGRLIAVKVITSSGAYTPTAGTKKIVVECQGGGGGGGGAALVPNNSNASVGAGGAGGAYAKHQIVAPAASYSVVIGAGGSGGTGENQGGNGGSTSFGSVVTCTGGGGGAAMPAGTTALAITTAAYPAVVTGGNISQSNGISNTMGLRISGSVFYSGVGGASEYGEGSSARAVTGNGGTSTAYGSGGSGAANSTNVSSPLSGGAGASGVVIVWEYA
ncbi:glycine-rich domain-containing protein [Escherichia coli]|uniref:glycine-rich domain-containing protein n=1 Tax=Escherichia coli TaxID=562 RepID=UPI0039C8CA50